MKATFLIKMIALHVYGSYHRWVIRQVVAGHASVVA